MKQQELLLQWQGNGEGAQHSGHENELMANAETPPCLLQPFDGIEVITKDLNGHSYCSISSSDNDPSSTTVELEDRFRYRLSELKVSELKAECRKRQMVMSGSKEQLVDRLVQGGFEEEILM